MGKAIVWDAESQSQMECHSHRWIHRCRVTVTDGVTDAESQSQIIHLQHRHLITTGGEKITAR